MAEEVRSIISYAEDIQAAEAPVPLPIGDYPGTIEAAAVRTSQNSGNDYVSVTFRIPVESYPADYDVSNAPEGTVLTYGRLSPADNIQARHRMNKFREAIGAPGGRELDLTQWIGMSAVLTLVHEDYEGLPVARIKAVKAA